MTSQSPTFLAAVAISALAFALHAWTSQSPSVKPDTVPDTQFSAQRADRILRQLLRDEVPHPVGSAANKRVRQRITGWLEEQGIASEVQREWGCSKRYNGCALVENVIAIIPGQQPGPYVAMMAHYDSVPMAPGAGDDGAGVATVLEVGRMLMLAGPHRNPVLLLLTDAEEAGLLGAEAFFDHHPDAGNIGVLLNVEGSGTTGPSQILRTTPANKTLVDTMRRQMNHPFGASLNNEVFKRMPNDTDFTVSARAGVAGIDFAFAAERNHYHTPNDSLDNLDQRTLQHHGENILPVALAFAGMDLGQTAAGKLVYMTVFGKLLSWPPSFNYGLLAFSLCLLCIAAYRFRLHEESISSLVSAAISPYLVIASVSAFAFVAFMLVDKLNGTTLGWPAHQWAFRLTLFASAAAGGLLAAWLLNRWTSTTGALLGSCLAWSLLGAITCLFLADAANVFLVPLVAAALLLLIASIIEVPRWRAVLLPGCLIFVVPHTLGIALLLETTQGYELIATTYLFLGLFMATLAPFVRGRGSGHAVLAALVLAAGGVLGASTLPLYSAWRPQHVNIHYVHDLDKDLAYWHLDSSNPAPQAMLATADFDSGKTAVYDWLDTRPDNVATTTVADYPGPEVLQRTEQLHRGGREIALTLVSQRNADWLRIAFSPDAPPTRFKLGKNDIEPIKVKRGAFEGQYAISVFGIKGRTVDITVRFAGTQPVTAYLFDGSTRLPGSAAPLLEARPPLGSPVHRGDQAVLIRRIVL